MDRYATPLQRVRGLGSAKEGVNHWWLQRISAIALVPLVIWFVASVVALTGAPLENVTLWLGSPLPALLTVLLLIAGFYHAQLGLQVVIEDYVHHEGLKVAAILLVKGAAVVLALAGVFAVLKLAFGG